MLSELLQLIILKGNVSMKKILIVDDDKRVVRMLEEYMKLYNFQTLCAGNGKDALALYDETVDLIILDINMQGMDGVEVCRRIRKQGNVPIIMLSANAASFDKVEALAPAPMIHSQTLRSGGAARQSTRPYRAHGTVQGIPDHGNAD